MMMFAAGIADIVIGQSSKNTAESYKNFVDSVFPFAARQRVDSNEELIKVMKKEAEKGPISFTPVETPNLLQQRAKQMRLPDEFRQKLQQRARQRR